MLLFVGQIINFHMGKRNNYSEDMNIVIILNFNFYESCK